MISQELLQIKKLPYVFVKSEIQKDFVCNDIIGYNISGNVRLKKYLVMDKVKKFIKKNRLNLLVKDKEDNTFTVKINPDATI